MDWSGVDYLWIIVMFLSAVWTLILTAPIHCRASIAETVMQCYISPNLMKKQTHLHLGWPKDIFQQIKFFGWTIPLSNCFVSGYYYDIMCEVNSLCFSRCNQFTKQTWDTVLKGYRPQLLTHKHQKRSTNVKRWVLNITTQQITYNNDKNINSVSKQLHNNLKSLIFFMLTMHVGNSQNLNS